MTGFGTMIEKTTGREPAVFFSLLAGVALAVVEFVHVPDAAQGAVNAVVLALTGLGTAAAVAAEKVLPAVVGFVQAVFALLLAYGTPVPAGTQTAILGLIAAVAAWFVRQNVEAPVSASAATARSLGLTAAFKDGFHSGVEAHADDAHETGFREGFGTSVAEATGNWEANTSGAHGITEVFPAVHDESDNKGVDPQ